MVQSVGQTTELAGKVRSKKQNFAALLRKTESLLQQLRFKVKPAGYTTTEIKLSEVYGWRGQDVRVYYLSPWEFVKWWTLKKLRPPPNTGPVPSECLSEWMPDHDLTSVPEDGWQFGRDYCWKENIPSSLAETILRLPEQPSVAAAAEYYLERHSEALVPYPTSCPLPRPDMSKEDQARLLNVYLRPWTLDATAVSLHVPHITALDLSFEARTANRPTHRLRTKISPGARNHQTSWREYIHSHIVSHHAKRTIQNFLAAAECSPEETDPVEAPVDHPHPEVDTSWVDVATVQKLTQGIGFEYSKRSNPAVQQILATWGTQTPAQQIAWKVSPGIPELPPSDSAEAARRAAAAERPPAVRWIYGNLNETAAADWLRSLQQAETGPVPTPEQSQFLQAIVNRCLTETTEEQTQRIGKSEPWRGICHGVPGAGKSQTLKWLRRFFEELCGRRHQTEFVYLAPQNTQAALIQGMTLHAFANIRIKAKGQGGERERGPDQFVQYQRLRWLVLDEISTVGLEVLGTLEKKVAQATRTKGTWKNNGKGEARPFGGLNLILTGDLWQFPPVKATAIFQNPFAGGTSCQVAGLQKVLWSRTESGIHALFELTTEQRCVDPWLSLVLKQARHGSMSQDVWCFLHGFPTRHPGAWDFDTKSCLCGTAACQTLPLAWATTPHLPWEDRLEQECPQCRIERRRRCMLGRDPKSAKFAAQPFIHGLNTAKYIATNLRAREVAVSQQQTILWAIAADTPLFHLDTDAPAELQARKSNWLQRHDQATGGIVGILPLLPNMPIRITQTLPELKPFGLFKNTRGTLYSWTLHELDIARLSRTTPGAELVLEKLPLALYVQIPGSTWQLHPALPPGVACIKPTVQQWTLQPGGRATIARRGFPVASDYSGTAHSFMGATLEACTLDLGFWDTAPSRDAQLSAYMCLSRVKRCEDVCVTHAFSPNLFQNGELTGPHTYLEFHRKKLSLAQAKARFEKDAPKRRRQPDVMLYCRNCSPRSNMPDRLLPLRDFVTVWDREAWYEILEQGMDRLCTQCRSPESGKQPPTPTDAPDACAHCRGKHGPSTTAGFCRHCLSTVRLSCARCDKGKKIPTKTLHQFTPEEIRRKKATNDVRRARCKTCVAKTPSATAKQGLCIQCDKAISITHLRNYSYETNAGVCRACTGKRERAPKTCPQCSQPVKAAATLGAWCLDCAYPNCDGCGNEKRPQNGKYHAKRMPEWTCQKCLAKKCLQGEHERAPKTCPQCSQPVNAVATLGAWCLDCAYPNCDGCGTEKRPQNGKYHAKRMPAWTCQKCLTKKCVQCDAIPGKYQDWCVNCAFPPCRGGCGQHRPNKNLKYHAQNIPEWYCDTCRDGYPPCPGCGAARPDDRAYHVKNMPEWTCAKCLPKACSQCGRAMRGQATADTWCQACAYPPCDKCGRPRPKATGYHAKVQPQWTCEGCANKCCSTCGKPLGARARADAQCPACAFPPCSAGCGAERPSQTNNQYHVRHLPTWVRQNCQTTNAAAPPHNTQLGAAPKKRRMNSYEKPA